MRIGLCSLIGGDLIVVLIFCVGARGFLEAPDAGIDRRRHKER